jgi:hypothetical protein
MRALLVSACLGVLAPACLVGGTGTVAVETTPVVYSDPPAPQAEPVEVRPGFVFIRGHWNWQNGRWAWLAGHWERERAGQAWTEGRWEHRGNSWQWIDGSWTASTTATVTVTTAPPVEGGVTVAVNTGYPTAAPPALRVENYGAPRAGFVWIAGRWDWRDGAWAWVDGHWERERANQVWYAGTWELRGDRYVWIEGHWGAAAAVQPVGPNVRDHRH